MIRFPVIAALVIGGIVGATAGVGISATKFASTGQLNEFNVLHGNLAGERKLDPQLREYLKARLYYVSMSLDAKQVRGREIDSIGLVRASDVVDGCVVRMPKAYPVYDDAYQDHLLVIRGWLKKLGNLELAGRNGMHKYNNQDHSMMTALLAARNILGHGQFDTWKVNTDAQYHEEGEEAGEDARAVPRRVGAA